MPRSKVSALRLVTPNPTRGTTRIDYVLATAGPAKLELFSLSGQRLRVLMSGPQPAGQGSVAWDGRSQSGAHLAPGAYMLRLSSSSGATFSRSVVLLH